MPALTQARPRLWPLGLAIAACLFTAVMFLGGHASSSAATPHTLGTDTAPPPPPPSTVTTTIDRVVVQSTTITTTAPAPPAVTIILPPSKVYYTTITANVTDRHVQTQTQINQVNQTQVHQVITTNAVGETITANVTTVKTRQVVNVHDLTNVQTSQVFATATNTVDQTLAPAAVTKRTTTSFANKARLAIGAGGVAVTSAAGFGFLMLRRRGRYT